MRVVGVIVAGTSILRADADNCYQHSGYTNPTTCQNAGCVYNYFTYDCSPCTTNNDCTDHPGGGFCVGEKCQSTIEQLFDKKRCNPNEWLQYYGSVEECMNEILSKSNCNHEYFNHATNADQNCGCVTNRNINCEDDANLQPPDEVRVYKIHHTPAPTPGPTPEPTVEPTPSPTPEPTPSPNQCVPKEPSKKVGDWTEDQCVRRCRDKKRCDENCGEMCTYQCECNRMRCADQKKWFFKQNSYKNCDWIAKDPDERCWSKEKKGVLAALACPNSCNLCGKKCVDSKDWFVGKRASGKGCEWVADGPEAVTKKRCKKKGKVGGVRVKAMDACPVACNTCDQHEIVMDEDDDSDDSDKSEDREKRRLNEMVV